MMSTICCIISNINLNSTFHQWNKTHIFVDIFVADIDECEDPNQCGNPHTNHTICVNIPGSFTCLCQRGYTLHENTGQCEGMYTHIDANNGYLFVPWIIWTFVIIYRFVLIKSHLSEKISYSLECQFLVPFWALHFNV